MSSYNNLTDAEKGYVKTHPYNAYVIHRAKEIATKETRKRFGKNGRNDKSDAFRHCYWSSMVSRDIGEAQAKIFADLHESSPHNPVHEKLMDIFNNSVGIGIGRNGGGDISLSRQCYQALTQKKLKVLR